MAARIRTNAAEVMRDLTREVEQFMVRLNSNVTEQLIIRTPKDLGWAQANWVPNVGTPAEPVPTPPGREARRQAVAAAAAKQKEAIVKVNSYKLGQGSIFIANGVVYIGRLQEGHSQQAPNGFVEQAIEEGLRVTNQ